MATEYSGLRDRERNRPQSGSYFEDHEVRERVSSRRPRNPSATRAQQLANGLGYCSIALGAAQLIAPAAVARAAGLPYGSALVRACGVRELLAGVGILNRPARRSPFLWMRVAGDVMDLALLGAAATAPSNRYRENAIVATAAVAGVTLLDLLSATSVSRIESSRRTPLGQPPDLEASMIVNRSPEECYRFWRDFEAFPKLMPRIQSVQMLDDKRSHWVARTPGGGVLEWDSEIVSDVPNSLIAWRSTEGASLPNSGWVRFEPAPGGRGTIVRLHMQLDAKGSVVGSIASKLTRRQQPKMMVREDLRRFKQLIETGEIPTTHGQPAGRRSLIARRLHPESDAAETTRSPAYEG